MSQLIIKRGLEILYLEVIQWRMNLDVVKDKDFHVFGLDFLTYLFENEPQTFKEAVTSPEAPFWKEAINSEVESILSNHTWKLVDLPPGNKPL